MLKHKTSLTYLQHRDSLRYRSYRATTQVANLIVFLGQQLLYGVNMIPKLFILV